MAESTILTPIELTDTELDAVSGGSFAGLRQGNSNGTRQSIYQGIKATADGIHIGGGGPTAYSGNITLNETVTVTTSATISNMNTQSNANSGAIPAAAV